MAVRSTLLAITTQVTAGSTQDVYVVPAGRTAIIRHWSIVNQTGEVRRVMASVRRGASIARIAVAGSLANDGVLAEPRAQLVLSPGDAFGVFSQGASGHMGTHVVLAGSLLEGVST